jgi:hypothetical protein
MTGSRLLGVRPYCLEHLTAKTAGASFFRPNPHTPRRFFACEGAHSDMAVAVAVKADFRVWHRFLSTALASMARRSGAIDRRARGELPVML